MTRALLCLAIVLIWSGLIAQKNSNYKVQCVAFYNLENLFDTVDDTTHNDDDFTPAGANAYTAEVYQKKLSNLSQVISELGTELTPKGPAILGVCEIENRSVLEDLVAQESIADRKYKIIHYDSPDHRGIDVALLYQARYFQPEIHFVQHVATRVSPDTSFTRDVLFVIGKLQGERIMVTVNHWPSRRGGQEATAPLRNGVARVNSYVIDSIQRTMGVTKHIVMGDLNDDPTNDSVTKYLRAEGKSDNLDPGEMFNPMWKYYRKGFGTTAWRDAWSLFDQIIFSDDWVNDEEGLQFFKAKVHNPRHLVQKDGHFKGYPFRSFAGGKFINGYSDHFPVYAYVIQKAE